MKKILLIDGNSLLFRAYYGSVYLTSALSTKSGIPTNGVYLFVKMVTNIINDNDYFDIKVAFDKGKKTFRHDKMPEYKSGRKQTPPDLISQFPIAKVFLDSVGIEYFELDNIEADDIIGSICKIAEENDFKVEILTSDQDMYQLISDKTVVVSPNSGTSDVKIYDKNELYNKLEIKPEQVVDYKALKGDSSDNIKGVAGIGDKTARELIHLYDNLEGIYENIDSILGSKKIKLLAGRDSAFLSKEIATIKIDVEIKNLSFCELKLKLDLFKEFLIKYEMNSIMKKLNMTTEKKAENFVFKIIDNWDIDFEDEQNYIYVENIDENYHESQMIGFAISNSKGNFYYNYKNKNIVDDLFVKFLNNKNIQFGAYDLKKITQTFKKIGINIDINIINYDMMIACYLLNSNIKSNIEKHILLVDLENLVPDSEEIFGKGVKKTSDINHNLKAEYICKKAFYIKKYHLEIIKMLEKNELLNLYNNIELPFSKVLLEIEDVGVKIDKEELVVQTDEILIKIDLLENEIKQILKDHIDNQFNPSSPKQIKEILFNKLGLKDIKKGSTDKEVLELLINDHPVVEKILEYRKYTKIYTTYLRGFEKYIDKNNRVHTIFNQTLTQTGRLSSSYPNLQNISIRDEIQKNVRKIFVTDEDKTFISYDYSQIELRVLADMADEENLITIFENNGDVHKESARKIFNLPLDGEITNDQRRAAKVFNFGIIYGMSDFGLAKDLNISIAEAKDFIVNYFNEFPKILDFKNEMISNAKEFGYVMSLSKRRRYINEIKNPNRMVQQFGERAAVNMPIQGTAADILKVAMVEMFMKFKENNLHSKIIAQIHDEIIIETVNDEIKIVQKIVKDEMENAYINLLKITQRDRKPRVKLQITETIGKTWFDLK